MGALLRRRFLSLITFISRRFSTSLNTSGFARFTHWVGIGSVALGCLALILSIAVLQGYEEHILSTAMRFTSHLEVHPIRGRVLPDHNTWNKAAEIASIDTMLTKEALIRWNGRVDGTILQGIHNGSAQTFLKIPAFTDNNCALGAELARKLNVGVGDTTIIFAAENSEFAGNSLPTPIVFTMVVQEVFMSGMMQVDATVILCNINSLRTSLRTSPSDYSMLRVNLVDASNVETSAMFIEGSLNNTGYVLTFKERYASIWQWIDMQKKPIPIVLGLITIVAMFTVLSAVLIAVVEKTESIALLSVMGMSRRSIVMVVMLRGLKTGLLGGFGGTLVAFTLCAIQHVWKPIALDGTVYYVSYLPVSLAPLPFVVIPLVSVLLCLLASLVPTVIALRIRPAAVLRFS